MLMKRIALLFVLCLSVITGALAQQPFFKLNGHERAANGASKIQKASSGTVELSYLDVNQQMWNDMGISVNGNWRIGVAVIFPNSMVAKYVGKKVTHISFGWNTTKFSPKADFFVRTSLDGENVASASASLVNKQADASNWEGSWNKIKLDEPYVIEEGKDLIVGYFADMKPVAAGESCIPFSSYGTVSPEKCQYIMNCSVPTEEGGNQWIELINEQTGKPTSPLFASATIVDEGGTMVNLCEIMDLYCLPVQAKDQASGGIMRLINPGTNNITSVELVYRFGEQSHTEAITFSKAITPANQSNVSLPFYALGSGKHTVEVSKVNGVANKVVTPKEYSTIGVPAEVAANYVMKPLVEYFCAENDHNSAKYYEMILLPGLEVNGNRMVVVNQHMNDQFMTFDFDAGNEYDDATTLLIDFVNGDLSQVYMPVMAVNRTSYPNVLDPTLAIETNPAIWVVTPMFVDALLYGPALSTPTFASVAVNGTLSDDKKEIDITVNGDIAAGVLPEGEKLYLTVYVMEDNVYTNSQEKPDDEDFMALFPGEDYWQQNVIRTCLTPMYGMEVGDGGTYEQSFSVEMDSDWDPTQMTIVAFLSRSKTNACDKRNIINAAESKLGLPDAIAELNAHRAAPRIYNLNGQQITRPTKGIYVVGDKKAVL